MPHAWMHLRYGETSMRPPPLTWFLIIAAIVYAMLVGVAIALSLATIDSKDEAIKLAAVLVSVLTAALAAVASITVALVQRENNQILADLQAKAAKQLEGRKVQITAEQKAYDELSGAASYYYYAVKTIEYGQVDEAQIKSAENGMVAACRYLVAINKNDTLNWMKVWQRARYMALEVAPKEADERKSLYSQHIKELDQDYESFFDAARKQHLTRASAVRAISE